ncbi:hydrophobin 3 precursor [Coniochaeta ligniaria NRRL 30616]|uniref:Hydrophobin 3 n=1 Tax=Coniochaeta ligniaria NRRL 30616 TaxID=1408157 RepID=A0A1J7IK23_9PEZI|nr:hydrophobin 3 precursor [Coniochaeta ligniaria NRRL 30616]
MKTTSIIVSILSMALAATAAPVLEDRTSSSCKPTTEVTQQVCCSGLLDCVVQVLGNTCSTHTYNCKTDAPVGGLVNVALLNCVSIL